MAGVDITGGGGGGISLTKDIYVNNSLIGPFDSTSDVNVFLQNGSGGTIVPTSSVLVGNDLTITANIPVPSGVALQFPNPSRGVSIQTGDTGWRAQNGWYNYTPPTYPAKYAQLDTSLGANQWYRLKTALTVNGVTSTERFVDLSGVQGWPALNNLNVAVLDKLTGLMFTRTSQGFLNWGQAINAALAYSVTINGNTYSDWYVPSTFDWISFLGTYPTTTWIDPISSLTIIPTLFGGDGIHTSDAATSVNPQNFITSTAAGTFYGNGPNQFRQTFYVHDAKNLIS